MAWDLGINFRQTAGYVNDVTHPVGGNINFTYALASESYPTNRTVNGVSRTFGFSNAYDGRDRDNSASLDVRFAGIYFVGAAAFVSLFQVDLPLPGAYTIRLALGDRGSGQATHYAEIRDNTTVLATINDPDGTIQGNYTDATGVNRTEANWPSLNAPRSLTFTTTTFILSLGHATIGSGTSIAHLFISQVAPTGIPRQMMQHGLYTSGGVGR